MVNKSRLPKVILLVLWISALLTYLSLSPASISMMQMGERDSHTTHQASDNHSTMPCCEMIGTTCTALIGCVSEFANIFVAKGSQRIANATIISQPIFLDTLSPPPKA